MTVQEAIDIVGDLKISLRNHSIGLDKIENKRTEDRINALNVLLNLAFKNKESYIPWKLKKWIRR